LVPASELIVIEETGGFVIGAFGADGSLLGVVVGWGGFVRERPRIVSDFLGVRSDVRALGLGTELKKLQAALALERGFSEIVWTVDPLRAGNARLNFEKLGAYADRYEVNRYGEGFGTGLYGGLPTDRVHLTWPIASPAVHERLLGRVPPRTSADLAGVPRFQDGNDAGQAVIEIPADIDALLARDSSAARDWRLRLRTSLQQAFTQGFRIIGFVPATNPDEDRSTYLIERCTD
jgi:predicted GNAT superfamily acetyltransferase